MSLRIVLDKAGPYQPGSKISGQVELTSSSDEAIAFIDISFTGRCKVKIRKHDHYTTISYRSRGYYFAQHLSLYAEGKYKHKAGTYNWPFSFDVPEHASRRLVSGAPTPAKIPTSWRPKRQLSNTGVLQPAIGHELESDTFSMQPPWRASALNALQPHALPESFSYTHSGFPADFEGKVEYTLTATLTRPSGSILFAPKNLECSLDIMLKPQRPSNTRSLPLNVQIHDSEHIVSTLRLLPENVDRKLSFMEKTRSALNSSSLPSCVFKATVTMPRYLDPSDTNEMMPFAIELSRIKLPSSGRNSPTFDEIPTPSVKLTSFSLWIRARTMLRDNGKSAIDQNVDYQDKLWSVQKAGLTCDVPVLDARIEPTRDDAEPQISRTMQAGLAFRRSELDGPSESSSLDLGKLLRLRLEPGELAPDFSTYNIFRSYTMGYKIRLESLGESIDVSRDAIKVRVLPELAASRSRPTTANRRSPEIPSMPPTPPSENDEKRGSRPATPPPEAYVGEDDLPQYERDAAEGPLPAFQQ